MNMTPEQVEELVAKVQSLQAEVTALKASQTSTPMDTPAGTPVPTKSEKLPDPPMFTGIRKELRPFVTKLRLKLQENADRYPMEWNKVNYAMSRLEGDAAITMDPFFRNGTFKTLGDVITLLEQTYDDASREYTAMAKLEELRQKNREFTSFFSEFLGLVGELDWNESAKIAALRRAISDELRAQLVTQTIPKTLGKFASLCQQIDENLRYNQSTRSRRTAPNKPAAAPNPTMTPPDPMDLDALRQYAPAGSDERKTRKSKGLCFGCGQRGHLHKDCPTNPYSKIRQKAQTNLSENARIAPRKSYAASVASTTKSQKPKDTIRVPTSYEMSSESENESS
jgi:hypothetical protein